MSGVDRTERSIFGKVRMGYALVESGRIAQWQRFAGEALGMHVERDGGALVCRLDVTSVKHESRRGQVRHPHWVGTNVEMAWSAREPIAGILVFEGIEEDPVPVLE